jgi:hypothetical protein
MLPIKGATIFTLSVLTVGMNSSDAGSASKGELYFTTNHGGKNVNKIAYFYDDTLLSIGPIFNVASTAGADGLIFAADRDLLVGGQGNTVHKVNITT